MVSGRIWKVPQIIDKCAADKRSRLSRHGNGHARAQTDGTKGPFVVGIGSFDRKGLHVYR